MPLSLHVNDLLKSKIVEKLKEIGHNLSCFYNSIFNEKNKYEI